MGQVSADKCPGFRRRKASRTLAGGPSEASDHRKCSGCEFDPGWGRVSLRDRCRGRKLGTSRNRWSLAALGPPANIRDACRRRQRSIFDLDISPLDIHRSPLDMHRSKSDLHISIFDMQRSLFDLDISPFDLPISLPDLCISRFDIDRSVFDIARSMIDLHRSLPDLCISPDD